MIFEGEFRFGFLALTDAAPLIVADRLGFFAEAGLNVVLEREASWATARDKLAAGLLDGAHMLAQIVIAARLGVGGVQADLIAPIALNVNGAGITLSRSLLEQLGAPAIATSEPLGAEPLAKLIRARDRDAPHLTFGVVFPFSTHAYLLRDWLARGGVNPDQDVRLVVLPPTAMAERMRAGELDGFCVGAPWNAVAEAEGLGCMVAHSGQLDPGAPDKVFAVEQGWAARNAEALQATLRALKRAALWADEADPAALSRVLAAPDALNADPAAIARALETADHAERILFAVGAPDPEHGRRILDEMKRWGQIAADADPARVSPIYRPDLFDQATI